MKLVIDKTDVLDMVDSSGDNILRVNYEGKLLVSYSQLERIVKMIVNKELRNKGLIHEDNDER